MKKIWKENEKKMKNEVDHMRYNKKIIITLFISLLLLIISFIPGQTTGKEITNFDNGGGQTSVEVELLGEPGLCTDSTTYFSIPKHKGKIQEASLKITTLPDQYGNYLLDPKLDVGVDGDIEWAYSGKGFGYYGYQNQFSVF